MTESSEHDDCNRCTYKSCEPVDIVFKLFFCLEITWVDLGCPPGNGATSSLQFREAEPGDSFPQPFDAALDVGKPSNWVRAFADRFQVWVIAFTLEAAIPFRRYTAISALGIGWCALDRATGFAPACVKPCSGFQVCSSPETVGVDVRRGHQYVSQAARSASTSPSGTGESPATVCRGNKAVMPLLAARSEAKPVA